MWSFILISLILGVIALFGNAQYKKTSYYQITHKPYIKLRNDIGSYGEYYIYKNLKQLEKGGAKFLFNCYLPRENGETTEIDVLLLHKSGIYVFESKNYSGWIFGNEKSKTWTQTLPQGKGRKARKEHFLNPIFQNELHIKCLKDYLQKDVSMYSVITFSERCELKKVEIKNPDYHVIHRSDAIRVINSITNQVGNVMSEQEISEVYSLLYPCTQVSEQTKQQHIDDIHNRLAIENVTAFSENESQNEQVIKIDADINNEKGQVVTESLEEETTENKAVGEVATGHAQLLCPKCGAELVLRQAKRGENKGKTFYGCSNYPKCRYIQKVEE